MARLIFSTLVGITMLASAISASADVLLSSGSAIAQATNPKPAGTTYVAVGANTLAGGGLGGGLDAPVTFVSGTGIVTISIFDCCTVGDVFEVLGDGVSLGLTSAVPVGGGGANTTGVFNVSLTASASHQLDLWDIPLAYVGKPSPFDPVGGIVGTSFTPAGVDYVITGPGFDGGQVSEPGMLALLGIGLAAVGLRNRKAA